jgi:hypothetical protein
MLQSLCNAVLWIDTFWNSGAKQRTASERRLRSCGSVVGGACVCDDDEPPQRARHPSSKTGVGVQIHWNAVEIQRWVCCVWVQQGGSPPPSRRLGAESPTHHHHLHHHCCHPPAAAQGNSECLDCPNARMGCTSPVGSSVFLVLMCCVRFEAFFELWCPVCVLLTWLVFNNHHHGCCLFVSSRLCRVAVLTSSSSCFFLTRPLIWFIFVSNSAKL